MAFIVREDGEGVEKPVKSPLSLAPLDRAIDCLKLAQMGSAESRRAWNLFAEESPGLARVVAKAVAKDNEKIATATKAADAMLVRGEQQTALVTKSWKPKRQKPVKVSKAAKALTKAAGKPVRNRQEALRAMVEADLRSPDPDTRETAMAMLARGMV